MMTNKKESFLNAIASIISSALSSVFFVTILGFEKHIIIIFSFIFIAISVSLIISWINKSFTIDDNLLQIKTGIFNRKTLKIPRENIISFDITRSFKQRIFRLNSVRINTTNRSEDIELVLNNEITKEFTAILSNQANSVTEIDENTAEELQKRKLGDIFLFAFSYGSFLSYLTMGITLWFLVTSFDIGFIFDNILYSILFAIAFLLVLKLAVVCWNLIKYHSFTVEKTEKEFKIDSGIFNKNASTLKIERITAICISQTLLFKLFNKFTVTVCLNGIGDDESNISIIYPVIDAKDLDSEVQSLLPDFIYAGDKKRISKRHWLYYKNARYGDSDKLVYLEKGILTKRISVIKKSEIDSFAYSRNFINRIKKTKKLKIDFVGKKIGDLSTMNGIEL